MTTYTGRDFWEFHPTPWPLVTLRKEARLGTGHTPSRQIDDYWLDCTVPWVTTEDLSKREESALQPLVTTRQKISDLGLANSAAELHPAGTVMLSRTASVGYVTRIGLPMATTQAFVTWTCAERLDPRYLTAVLLAMNPEFFRLAYGSTHLTIYMPDIEQLRVPLPPLEEQRAIADFLDAETARIDALIAKKQQLVHLLEERRTGLSLDLVSGRSVPGKRRFSGIDWIGTIPEDWTTPSVSARYQLLLGRMLNSDRAASGEQKPYLRNVNVRWGTIDLSDVATMDFPAEERVKYALKKGDLLVCEGGAGYARAAVWDGRLHEMYFQKSIHRVRRLGEWPVEWLAEWLRAGKATGVFASQGNLATIPHLTAEQLSVHRIPMPAPEVMIGMLSALEESEHALEDCRRGLSTQLALLAERRQALITAAVTGEFQVPGAA